MRTVPAMDTTIHQSFLPHRDPDASVAFYTDVLGFEVRLDVGDGEMRFTTVGPPNQPDTRSSCSLRLLILRSATPSVQRSLAMMDKGTFAGVNLATPDLDA